MKRDLVMGWLFIAMALIMVFCIVVNCVNGSWGNLPICGFAFGMNISSAVNRFRDYKRHKQYEDMYSLMSMRCWSDYDEDDDDEPEDNNSSISEIISD